MKTMTTLAIGAAFAFSLTLATGCREEGPAEKAGKAIDQALDDVMEEAEEAKKKLE